MGCCASEPYIASRAVNDYLTKYRDCIVDNSGHLNVKERNYITNILLEIPSSQLYIMHNVLKYKYKKQ